jgi:hypothetical protein
MARLSFRFTPLDSVDFDVCAGPAQPPKPQVGTTDEPAPPEPNKTPTSAEG